jgi:hypothetical protein
MTPDQARSAVYKEFALQWADRTVLHRDGEAGFVEPNPGIAWVRLSFRNLGGGQLTLGPALGRKYRRTASAFVQVFTPPVQGVGVGATLAHDARAILEGVAILAVGTERVEFNDGVVTESPFSEGEKFRQTNVEVRCSYDETK